MNNTFIWDRKTLSVIGDECHLLTFEQTVMGIIDYGDILIVMTDIVDDNRKPCYENIFGIVEGKTIWTIENFLAMYPSYGRKVFVGIRDHGNGEFLAIDGSGRRFIYSVQTGKIIRYLDWVK